MKSWTPEQTKLLYDQYIHIQEKGIFISPEYKNIVLDLYRSQSEILSNGHQTTIATDPNDRPKLEGYPIPEDNIIPPLITPLPEVDKNDGKMINPIIKKDKDSGKISGTEIDIGDWRDYILTNKDKSFVDYKKGLNKGDQIDLSKFTNRQKVSEGKANYVDPKTGWVLSPDRAGTNSHGGSSWKLLDRKGKKIATLDIKGNVLRK